MPGPARSAAARTLIVIGALVVTAWFVVGARQASDTSRAAAIAGSSARLDAAQALRADSLLRDAAFLNPDREVQLLRAQVALARGERRQARQLAAGVTGAEPLNAEAWVALARASGKAGFFRALEHVAALVPPVHHRR